MKIEILHYVKYVRVKADLPINRQTAAVRSRYPDAQNISLIESDERGTVYKIESPLPGRL